jgi:hypothetical protein
MDNVREKSDSPISQKCIAKINDIKIRFTSKVDGLLSLNHEEISKINDAQKMTDKERVYNKLERDVV